MDPFSDPTFLGVFSDFPDDDSILQGPHGAWIKEVIDPAFDDARGGGTGEATCEAATLALQQTWEIAGLALNQVTFDYLLPKGTVSQHQFRRAAVNLVPWSVLDDDDFPKDPAECKKRVYQVAGKFYDMLVVRVTPRIIARFLGIGELALIAPNTSIVTKEQFLRACVANYPYRRSECQFLVKLWGPLLAFTVFMGLAFASLSYMLSSTWQPRTPALVGFALLLLALWCEHLSRVLQRHRDDRAHRTKVTLRLLGAKVRGVQRKTRDLVYVFCMEIQPRGYSRSAARGAPHHVAKDLLRRLGLLDELPEDVINSHIPPKKPSFTADELCDAAMKLMDHKAAVPSTAPSPAPSAGDSATQSSILTKCLHLFDDADKNKDNRLSVGELANLTSNPAIQVLLAEVGASEFAVNERLLGTCLPQCLSKPVAKWALRRIRGWTIITREQFETCVKASDPTPYLKTLLVNCFETHASRTLHAVAALLLTAAVGVFACVAAMADEWPALDVPQPLSALASFLAVLVVVFACLYVVLKALVAATRIICCCSCCKRKAKPKAA